MNQLKHALLERSLAYWLGKSAEITDGTLATFQQEQAILQNLIHDALINSTYQEQAAQLLLTLQPLIERRGIADQWLPLAQQAHTSLSVDQQHYWEITAMCGYLHYLLHAFAESRALLEPVVENSAAPALAQGDAAHYLSCLHHDAHQIALAQTYAQKARAHYEQLGDALPRRKLATSSAQQGLLAGKLQEMESANRHFKDAVELWEQVGDETYLGRTLFNWSNFYLLDKTSTRALQLLQRAETVLSVTDSEPDKARILLNLGTYFALRDEWLAAKTCFESADSSYIQHSSDQKLQAWVNNNLGGALTQLGQYDQAEARLRLSIATYQQLNNPYMLGVALGGLAELQACCGQHNRAADLYQQAVDALSQLPNNADAVQHRQLLQKQLAELDC